MTFGGGSVDELAACAGERHVGALYALHEGRYVSYIPGVPDFVNREFRELYPDGIAPSTPLVAASNGPPSPAPATVDGPPRPWQACLHGAVAGGFSLVLWPTATRPRARGGGAAYRSCRPRRIPGSRTRPIPPGGA